MAYVYHEDFEIDESSEWLSLQNMREKGRFHTFEFVLVHKLWQSNLREMFSKYQMLQVKNSHQMEKVMLFTLWNTRKEYKQNEELCVLAHMSAL